MTDVLVVGAGPAGVAAATLAAALDARTTLVTAGDFGGMAANDGPAPSRTLAHAAREAKYDVETTVTRFDELAGLPLSFPTYAGILARAAASAAYRLHGGAGEAAQAVTA